MSDNGGVLCEAVVYKLTISGSQTTLDHLLHKDAKLIAGGRVDTPHDAYSKTSSCTTDDHLKEQLSSTCKNGPMCSSRSLP